MASSFHNPTPSSDREGVTKLLHMVQAGDRQAASDLIPILYRELHMLANRAMHAERHNHTLQPTLLVDEAYLQLLPDSKIEWQNKAHFLALASNTMRRVLVDHARSAKAAKRPGGHQQIELTSRVHIGEQALDVLDLNNALEHLMQFDERLGSIVEMRFFAGMSFEEIAETLHISVRTAKRGWALAKAWLHAELVGVEQPVR